MICKSCEKLMGRSESTVRDYTPTPPRETKREVFKVPADLEGDFETTGPVRTAEGEGSWQASSKPQWSNWPRADKNLDAIRHQVRFMLLFGLGSTVFILLLMLIFGGPALLVIVIGGFILLRGINYNKRMENMDPARFRIMEGELVRRFMTRKGDDRRYKFKDTKQYFRGTGALVKPFLKKQVRILYDPKTEYIVDIEEK